MQRRSGIASTLAVLVAGLTCEVWLALPARGAAAGSAQSVKLPAALVVVLDVSSSTRARGGPLAAGARCQELQSSVDRVWAEGGYGPLALWVQGTADGSLGNEPQPPLEQWTLLDGRLPPSAAPDLYSSVEERPMERAKERREKERQHQLGVIKKIGESCERRLRQGRGSPILLAIRRAHSELKDHCLPTGGERPRCSRQILFVHSDLQEGVDPRLRRRIERIAAKCPRAPAAGHPQIDAGQGLALPAQGLDIRVCGLSQTQGNGRYGEGDIDVDLLLEAWAPVFAGNKVRYTPRCQTQVQEQRP